jgi:hypothetical protein
MTNQSVVDLISQGLVTGLPHPGNPADGSQPHAIILPVFNPVGQPPEVADQITGVATSLAEAIVFLLEDKGISLVDTAELASLRTTYDPNQGQRTVSVYCRCDTTKPLLVLTVTDAPQVIIDGKALLSGFRTLGTDCPHNPEARP